MERSPALGTVDSSERGWESGQWGLWVGSNSGRGSSTHNPEDVARGLPSAVMVGFGKLGWVGELAFAAAFCTTQVSAVLAPRKALLAVTTPYLWTAGHPCVCWIQGWSASLLDRLHPGHNPEVPAEGQR